MARLGKKRKKNGHFLLGTLDDDSITITAVDVSVIVSKVFGQELSFVRYIKAKEQ